MTLNRGTNATGETRIGEDVLIMTGVHVAHDCIIGNNVILVNLVALGGHVEICLLYTSPSPRDKRQSRMPSSA